MHEFVCTQKLLHLALNKAGSKQIARVNLLIGPFSEQREESIRFYWKDLAKGSYGEGAELHFDHMPVPMKCLDCTGAFYLDDESSMCKYCDCEGLPPFSGEDVRLESIELK
jgi:hydrogenase nickel incorporation protein HypA/HybF